MRTIHKYELAAQAEQTLNLHSEFALLAIKEQNGVPCLWVEEDTAKPMTELIIHTVGTGQQITFETWSTRYFDTLTLFDGSLVFHFYYEIPNESASL